MALRDSRSLVRAGAWSALLSSDPTALQRFEAVEYEMLQELAAEHDAMNLAFCQRLLATNTAASAPAVYAAADAAATGTPAERAAFVASGYEAALQRDSALREAEGARKAALVEADRAFVRALAVGDPGPQVRANAVHATRPGATDADLVDFFAFGWASGGRLDLDLHRIGMNDREVRWKARLRVLVEEAQAAEAAARAAAGEAAEQLRAEAAQAWSAVGLDAGQARSAWADAQEIALAQAWVWYDVAVAASASLSPNWVSMYEPAVAQQYEWMADADAASQQASYWEDLLSQALEAESRLS